MGTVREIDVDTYGPTPLSHTLTDSHVQDTVRLLCVTLRTPVRPVRTDAPLMMFPQPR
jgi:hypothetical protein